MPEAPEGGHSSHVGALPEPVPVAPPDAPRAVAEEEVEEAPLDVPGRPAAAPPDAELVVEPLEVARAAAEPVVVGTVADWPVVPVPVADWPVAPVAVDDWPAVAGFAVAGFVTLRGLTTPFWMMVPGPWVVCAEAEDARAAAVNAVNRSVRTIAPDNQDMDTASTVHRALIGNPG